MAIKRSQDERLSVALPRADVLERLRDGLPAAGFSSVKVEETIGRVSGRYRRATVVGELVITLHAGPDGGTTADLRSTANTDNIFAMFSSPNGKILAAARSVLV